MHFRTRLTALAVDHADVLYDCIVAGSQFGDPLLDNESTDKLLECLHRHDRSELGTS